MSHQHPYLYPSRNNWLSMHSYPEKLLALQLLLLSRFLQKNISRPSKCSTEFHRLTWTMQRNYTGMVNSPGQVQFSADCIFDISSQPLHWLAEDFSFLKSDKAKYCCPVAHNGESFFQAMRNNMETHLHEKYQRLEKHCGADDDKHWQYISAIPISDQDTLVSRRTELGVTLTGRFSYKHLAAKGAQMFDRRWRPVPRLIWRFPVEATRGGPVLDIGGGHDRVLPEFFSQLRVYQ